MILQYLFPRLILICAALLLQLNTLTANAPSPGNPVPSLMDLFSRQEVVQINLTTNLDSLLNGRRTDDYFPATFNFTDDQGVKRTYQMSIKTRGKFRRRFCDFPPLKLKFSSKDLQAGGLSNMNELKLVTHCVEDKLESTEQIFREYMAYRLYNVLSPVSFRVQLARITYRDSDPDGEKIRRWGLLIEDVEELEKRTGLQEFDSLGLQASLYHPNYEKIASLFQFMIGNTDWNAKILHNIKLLKNQEGAVIPVPYDFDFATMVKASYARPNVNVGQTSMSQRVFMGFSASPAELYPIVSYFKSKKTELYKVVYDFDKLSEESRLDIIAWLDTFFGQVDNMDAIQKNLFEKPEAEMAR